MNSYPPELLAQLAPVMFVAGLDVPPIVPPASPPQSSNDGEPPPPPPPSKPHDAFHVLSLRLREALLAQRKVAIWQPEKNKSFQVVLVERDVRFPPRKLVPQDDPQYSAAHSPLSPLTPTSPLYPDGLIAPIWIRKHTTLVPSVFVMFLRIYEPPQGSKSPLDLPDADRETEERRKDAELASEVSARKKMTNDRGIKLTVVLMASRKMLDDPSLDARLTFIRRQSGLDSRAALFVLSPVSPSELHEFVRSLQQALYEPALDYYTAHSKRVRRKRNRHSQSVSSYPNTTAGLAGIVNIARPLRPEGWTVRYEYKMACFAEFRSEDEVALKHYQDAYETLLIMFGSTAILPPRTKRWAEAKVLADCINIKIVKLYLYNNEYALALSHHSTHIRQFGDFSRGWGIGEETFEFWSWIARQHRVLAELLEQGTRTTLSIPVHKPVVATSNPNLAVSQQTIRTLGTEYDAMRSLGINPSHALQHPGFYYYMAARCTEMRRERFLTALEAELSQKPTVSSPGFANEKKVEHLAIINELYTKAYELFKKHSPSSNQSQGRLTLWIAYRIAQTYYDAGKFDMAVRFFERIAKTYRRERWASLLMPLMTTWYACAQRLGDVELTIKLLVEMLGHDIVQTNGTNSLEEDLIAVLRSSVPSSDKESLVVDLTEAQPIFETSVVFWSTKVEVGDSAAFQLTLTAPSAVAISSIPFSSLTIQFSGELTPIVVLHEAGDEKLDEESFVRRVDLGQVLLPVDDKSPRTVKANLRWSRGDVLVFTGSLVSDVPTVMQLQSLTLRVEENGWKVDILFQPTISPKESPRWLSSLNPPKFIHMRRETCHSTTVKHRRHHLKVSFHHHEPAYLDEDYPIVIEIINTDSRDLDLTLSMLLQPTEIDDAVTWIVVDEEKSPSLIKDVHLGVLPPGESIFKTLHLYNTGAGGDRVVDVSVQSRTVTPEDEDDESVEDDDDDDDGEEEPEAEDEEKAQQDTMEHLKMLVVRTVNPFTLHQDVVYQRSKESWSGLADLSTFEESYWDRGRGSVAFITTTVICVGPWGVYVESLELERQDGENAEVINASSDLADKDMFPSEYDSGHEFCGICEVTIRPEGNEETLSTTIDGPGRYVVIWRRLLPDGERGPETRSLFPLPPLQRPRDELVALLDAPLKATLHRPISIMLTVRNYHPTRSANITVQLETDALDGFVMSGIRHSRVPVLLPSTEERLTWTIVPIECGYIKIPRIKVMDRRRAIPIGHSLADSVASVDHSAGDVVKIVDLRRDMRHALSSEDDPQQSVQMTEEPVDPGAILVLP